MKRTLTRIGTFLLALLIMVNIPLVAFAIPDVEPGQDIPSNEELVNVFSTEHNAVAEYLENGADNQLVSSESDIVGATIATGSIVAPFNNVGAHQVWSINHTTG
ncbi:MAG: hypothetical protein FWC66_08200 [Oscillospiraceae bacterium]|nr:hypothetical protein [Oscillospiraceae bacterium]